MHGLYKTELIRRRGPWRTVEDVELATLEWVDWYNRRRLHGACNDVPPAEYDAMFRNAGFASSKLHSLTRAPQSLVVSSKA